MKSESILWKLYWCAQKTLEHATQMHALSEQALMLFPLAPPASSATEHLSTLGAIAVQCLKQLHPGATLCVPPF